ncbi:oxysterol-binding protein-like protein [Trematosphaeria pertusa]|uniref:Oxysterol-binding protein-like protein n=1 Tax=Trematosphaeria pertusa TaxID=390896 RepID=A0A6A6IRP9_9PLEO|nr:oxysterol-binding protein-like protein [Trematosphaeria pertusa]KAF2252482.1 oxysterol-binding protein-like protein [Trematosphaeria pertusa]
MAEPSANSLAARTASTPNSAVNSKEPSRASTPANAPVEKPPDDSSKLKTFLGVLRRFIGVSDLAAVRFSLPAQLIEPIPNLEYWHYLDRPDAFISIGDSDEPLGRMLGTLRFWFTKDLKYVKGKPCKPYNSTLGEFFRCTWQIEDTQPPLKHTHNSQPSSSATSITGDKVVKVSYLTEQTSHHPPVSAFYVDCPEKGVIARGYDQLSAKFTGTNIRVIAGAHNLGIFITLQNRDNEEYQLTHPAAYLGGLLRGSLSVSVADSCYVTCAKTGIKVILEYLEEGWLGRTQNKVQGVIFKYDPDNDTKTRIKDVSDKEVLGRIEGCWQDKVYYTLGNGPFAKTPEKILLIDLNPLHPVPKNVPSLEEQLPNESRKFWDGVTNAIVNKQYSLATTLKQDIEENQRRKAAERKAEGRDWQPRFFAGAVTPVGKPDLTQDGEEALKGLHEDRYDLAPNKENGAF